MRILQECLRPARSSWRRRAALLLLLLVLPAAAAAQVEISGDSLYISSGVSTGTGGVATGQPIQVKGIVDRAFGTGSIKHLVYDGTGTFYTDDQVPRKNTAETITQPWRWSTVSPYIDFHETDGPSDEKFWRWISDAGIVRLQTVNDAYSTAADVLTIDRTGATATDATLYTNAIVRGATGIAARGFDNVSIGTNTGTPRILLEDAGSKIWEIDNLTGQIRFIRTDSAGTADSVPLYIDGNIFTQPLGRRILPGEPYGVDIGSQQYKFGGLWVGDLFADRLVTIENIGTIDNRWLIGNGNALDEDLSPSATTMITRYNNYATGTFVYLQKFARTEFIKTVSGATATNLHANPSLENGTASSWGVNAPTTVTASTAKSYHGEWSLLVDTTSSASYLAAGTLTAGVTYTTCVYARRLDGAAMVEGDLLIYHANAFVAVPAQSTQTDGWYRFCRTSVAGSAGGGSQQVHFISSVDMYLDAVQTEVTAVQRPFSLYRASYTITRNEDASAGGANQWYAGDGMFGVGKNIGDGWIDCYAIRGIKSATEQGPACVVNVRTGSSFNSWGPAAVWGNMDGLYGYSGATYGFAAGSSAAAWIAFDSTNGIRGMHGANKKFGITMAGVASFVEGAVTIDNLGLRIFNSSGVTGEALSYSFAGALSYTKRPLLGYAESGGAGTIVLSGGDRSSGNAHVLVESPVGNINVVSTDFDVNISAGSALNFTAATITVDGFTTTSTNFTCPAGQAVKSLNIYKGMLFGVACGVP